MNELDGSGRKTCLPIKIFTEHAIELMPVHLDVRPTSSCYREPMKPPESTNGWPTRRDSPRRRRSAEWLLQQLRPATPARQGRRCHSPGQPTC